MSGASRVCSLCLRPTEECGIVAGNVMEVYICASCADDALVTIRQEEEKRAAAAAADADDTVEGQVLDALMMAEELIVFCMQQGGISDESLNDREKKTLPTVRNAIRAVREVSA